VIVFKLMVINGLKSVNDAVSTMYKPAAGRVTPNKNEPKRYEAYLDLLPRFPTVHAKKWLTILQSPSIYISQDPRYPADWDL
jgi:hypothetical protein